VVSGTSPLEYRWDFGGAAVPNSSNDAAPVVELSRIGVFPASLTVSNGSGQDTYDLEIYVSGYSASGFIRSIGGAGMAGVMVNLGSSERSATTDSSGRWRIDNLDVGDYTVTPTHSDWYFEPVRLNFSIGSADVEDLDFTFRGPLNTIDNWVHTWDPEPDAYVGSRDMAVDADGNLLIVGGGDANYVKYSNAGDLLFSRVWETEAESAYLTNIAAGRGGSFYLGGWMRDTETSMVLLKLNSSGKLVWQRRLQGPADVSLRGLVCDSSGRLLLCADWSGEFSNITDCLVAALDSDGEPIWARTWGGADNENCFDICSNSAGDIVVCGETMSYGSSELGAFTLFFSAGGELRWAQCWETLETASGHSIAMGNNGCCYVAVAEQTSYIENSEDSDAIVAYDGEGFRLWSKRIFAGYTSYQFFDSPSLEPSILLMPDNSLYLADGVNTTSSNRDIALIKMDIAGNDLWRLRFSGAEDHGYPHLAADSNGSIFIAGMGANTSGGWLESANESFLASGVSTELPTQVFVQELEFGPLSGKTRSTEGTADTGASSRDGILAIKLRRP